MVNISDLKKIKEINKIKKINKKGAFEWEQIAGFLIVLFVLIILIIIAIMFKDKLYNLAKQVGDFLRFGK